MSLLFKLLLGTAAHAQHFEQLAKIYVLQCIFELKNVDLCEWQNIIQFCVLTDA